MNDSQQLALIELTLTQRGEMIRRDRRSVEDLLLSAISGIKLTKDRKPWNYGWYVADYRRSPRAAFETPDGSAYIDSAQLLDYERAVENLWQDQNVRNRWSREEFWSVVIGLMVNARNRDADVDEIHTMVDALRKASHTLVIFPVANVKWTDSPLYLADAVIGDGGHGWINLVSERLAPSLKLDQEELMHLLRNENFFEQHRKPGDTVLMACRVPGQSQLATEQAERLLENIVDTAMLLEADLGRLKMFSLRGAANRPGIRGLSIDRPALQKYLEKSDAVHELGARIIAISKSGLRKHHRWHSADPVPLSALLNSEQKQAAIDMVCTGSSVIFQRIRIAARWHAEAHWAIATDDAVLALGVALDALIGAPSGLPGRVMADRYALLGADPKIRRNLAIRHAELYKVRSAIAHGRGSKEADEDDFVRKMSADVRWASERLMALYESFHPQNEREFDEVFDDLRWGLRSWPSN
ncbi:hypothetical protein [Saccharothrix sp. HUAS TT1]|uniref:hypothetical protein n=1 Tax=unclassified Saccharothrix TaxID=2593673 RepID=UPI00345BA189